jgi:hypothetical protein
VKYRSRQSRINIGFFKYINKMLNLTGTARGNYRDVYRIVYYFEQFIIKTPLVPS